MTETGRARHAIHSTILDELNPGLRRLESAPGHGAENTDAAVRWTFTNDFSVELNHPMSHPTRNIAVMHFQPVTIDRPCWHCHWYAGVDCSRTVAYCER